METRNLSSDDHRERAFRRITPAGLGAPANHSHGVLVSAGVPCLYVTGQVGVDATGKIGATFEEQAEIACANLVAILDAAGMTAPDLVQTTAYLTSAADIPAWRSVRQRLLVSSHPASTLIVVSALAHPDWHVEIDAVAAQRSPS
jgi:2-iminobutanoate/2-iminopropanoate deaminase